MFALFSGDPRCRSRGGWSRHRPITASSYVLAAFLVLGIFSAVPTSSQRLVPITYPIAWSQVATSPPTSKNLTANCICDLLAYQCDIGCCCDPNCPADLTALSQSSGTCLPEGPPASTLRYCVPQGFMEKVNLPSNSDFYVITLQSADNEFIQSLLCIVSSSNPDLGAAYPDPPAGAVGDNAALATCATQASPSTPSQVYSYERQIDIVRTLTTGQSVTTTLQVPYPAFSDVCNDQFAVGFLLPTPISQVSPAVFCQRLYETVAATAAACQADTPLSPNYWTNVAFSPKPNTDSPVAVTLGTFQFLNPETGALSPLPASTSLVADYTVDAEVCANAVYWLNITIYYTPTVPPTTSTPNVAPGVIDSVVVDVIVTNFFGARSSTDGDNVTTVTPAAFEQYVTVGWLQSDSAATGDSQRIIQAFSGNPGYLPGFPVLAGINSTNNGLAAIDRLIQGLPLPGPGAEGACGPGGLRPVGFGRNISSTCSVPHTLDSLKSFCQANEVTPEYYVQQALGSLYTSLVSGQLSVGIWGNSQFNNTNQWLKVVVTGTDASNLVWTGNSCGNIVVGFDIQILWGIAFATNNLQNKILYINICFKTSTWTYPKSFANTSTPFRFYMNYTTQFISLDQSNDVYQVVKPAPPLASPLPYDIFYPFLIGTPNGAAPTAAPCPPALLTLLSAAAVALLITLATALLTDS